MAIGDPGKGEFRNLIIEHRNPHIAFGMSRVMDLREEVVRDDDMNSRSGLDDIAKNHFIQVLQAADRDRRLVTHNPDNADLGTKIANAIAVDPATASGDAPPTSLDMGDNPFGGDDIQMGSAGLYQLPWDFSGADPNIPLATTLDLANTGMLVLQSINQCLVAFTRLESSKRSRFLYKTDSLRIYGHYQQILALLQAIGGPNNIVDFAQVRATDEPRGPENAPNSRTETPSGGLS